MFFCGTELIVYHLTQTNVRFEILTIVFDDVIVFLPQCLRGTCRKSTNTLERRIQNLIMIIMSIHTIRDYLLFMCTVCD